MTAEQILQEIRALPATERQRLADGLRRLGEAEIPQDFLDALDDFENARFVSMETVLNEEPPGA
ncbi:MAG: hypothetical protein H0X40_08375 [Chthoniobacterales bacterium]|nr:hypothetical protein [Chthoniobacterales bacterium]